MDLPSRLDYFALGRQYVLQRATKIDPAQVDVQGSDVNVFVGVASVMADHITKQIAYGSSSLLLDGCEDDDQLARLAYDRYRLLAKGASPARTTAIMRRPAGGPAGTIVAGTKILTLGNIEYITVQDAPFGGSTLEAKADVRAVQAGKATQVGKGQFLRFAQPSSIFDPTIVVTNEQPAAGGEDAEALETFRERVREYWITARRGIMAAIEAGATTVPGVVSARAIEALAPGALPARVVNLYIADSSGVASDALARLVRTALDEFRAGGITVLIYTSQPLIVNITLALSFRARVDTLALTQNVRASVVEFVNSIPVNGPLYVGQLFSVLQRYETDGLIVSMDSIVAPVGDLVPAVGQTIRTTLENVIVL